MIHSPQRAPVFATRRLVVLGIMVAAAVLLLWRVVYLHVLNKDFLQQQGDARHLRVVPLSAHRGMITDRYGEPLAVSTPVDSVWANPQELIEARDELPRLAGLLGLDPGKLQRLLATRGEREFVYLKRHISPGLGQQVMALNLPGVDLQREYRRYYPGGEVTAHVIGFTNIDDVGQEGLELAYDDWLRGEPGAKRVIKDGKNRIVEDVESIRAPRPGKDLVLSMDRRIQYLAYRELKAAVQENKARSGSAVVLDMRTGEVLAMVNQPSYNPNNRKDLHRNQERNRAVTDLFEPGSTMKPFTIACALESGLYHPDTPIDTRPGRFQIGRHTITDVHDYGLIDVSRVIIKSSNVGASKIALSLPPQRIWSMFTQMGFGSVTGSGYPGEASGLLADYHRWGEIERATLSYGYGISVTPLQLAHAYATLALDGRRRPVTFLRTEQVVASDPLVSMKTVRQLRAMMEGVVSDEGTADLARIPGYRVAGKTGTVRIAANGGYAAKQYLAVFAGFAPASQPRLVMVVMIDDPQNGKIYGGLVAAPVFEHVMSGALRLLDIPPDNLPLIETRSPTAGGPA